MLVFYTTNTYGFYLIQFIHMYEVFIWSYDVVARASVAASNVYHWRWTQLDVSDKRPTMASEQRAPLQSPKLCRHNTQHCTEQPEHPEHHRNRPNRERTKRELKRLKLRVAGRDNGPPRCNETRARIDTRRYVTLCNWPAWRKRQRPRFATNSSIHWALFGCCTKP